MALQILHFIIHIVISYYNMKLFSRDVQNIQGAPHLKTYNLVCNCIDFRSKVWRHDFCHFKLKKVIGQQSFFNLKINPIMITIVKIFVMLFMLIIETIFV